MKKFAFPGTQLTKDLRLCRIGNNVAVLNIQNHSVVVLDLEYNSDAVEVEPTLEAYFVKTGRARTESPELIVRYHRTWPSWHLQKNPSVLTVAAHINYDQGSLRFGWSLCSQKDNFSKKIGRDLAIDRLNEGGVVIPYDPKKSIIQNIKADVNEDFARRGGELGGLQFEQNLIRHFFGV